MRCVTTSWWTARPARHSNWNYCRKIRATERIMLFFKPSLERMGITVNIRTVDPTQYENRMRNWDFDVVVDDVD